MKRKEKRASGRYLLLNHGEFFKSSKESPMRPIIDKSTGEPKRPFCMGCKKCGYEWIAFWTPIRLKTFEKFIKAGCPMCHASDKETYMGKKGAYHISC